MIKSPIVNPTPVKGWVSRQFSLGNACYDLDAVYSPDTGYGQSVVLDLAAPKFEPNKSYIFDKSRFNNHGTITGATWVRLPSGLWVLYFDGTDDNVTLPDVAILPTGTNPFTIKWWANQPALGAGAYYTYHRWKQDSELFIVSEQSPDVAFAFAFRGEALMTGTITQSSVADSYHQYVLTYNGGNKSLATSFATYVDITVDTLSAGDAAAGVTNANVIGNNDAAGIYKGYQDLWAVIPGAWTPAQVANSFNRERHLFGV